MTQNLSVWSEEHLVSTVSWARDLLAQTGDIDDPHLGTRVVLGVDGVDSARVDHEVVDVAAPVSDRYRVDHPSPRIPFDQLGQLAGDLLLAVGAPMRQARSSVCAMRTRARKARTDMISKLRKALIAARFSAVRPGQPEPETLRGYALARAAATS